MTEHETPGTRMRAEIRQQPQVMERLLGEGREAIHQAVAKIRDANPRFVLFVARGTSDHAALYGKYLVETLLGLPAGLASPSTITIYGARPRLRETLVVAISQSGSSPDIGAVIESAREAGATTLAITNNAGSPLASAADIHLDILAGPERAVAATKTYTAQLLVVYLLMQGLAGAETAGVDTLPTVTRGILDHEDDVAALAPRYRFAEQLVVTSRGYNYPTARETALKLMETGYLVAHAFSAADLLHGPMAMIDRGFPVIMLAPHGPASDALLAVVEALKNAGADTLIVGSPQLATRGTVSLPIPELPSEILSPLLLVIPMQQFALHLALQRGINPDSPRGLRKVTETW